jgi:hydrogenase/urease accessory protein HupE
MNNRLGIFTIAALTIATGAAQAHPGTEIGVGFIHPLSGADHLMHLLASAPAGLLIAGGAVLAGAVIGAGLLVRRSRQS